MDRIHRLIFEHRRLIAAVCTGLAVLTALGAVRQSPDGVTVLVARHDLPSGHIVGSADLRTATLPPSSRPSHTLVREDVIGRKIAGPMRRGEPLTDYRVLQPDALDGYGESAVLTAIRIDRTDGMTGLHVGDRVNVIAVDPDGETKARIVAQRVEIATLSEPETDTGGGMSLGIVTTEKVALALATAALDARFSVITPS